MDSRSINAIRADMDLGLITDGDLTIEAYVEKHRNQCKTINPLKDAAKEALQKAFTIYLKWQDNGDHDTFGDWVNDELTHAREEYPITQPKREPQT